MAVSKVEDFIAPTMDAGGGGEKAKKARLRFWYPLPESGRDIIGVAKNIGGVGEAFAYTTHNNWNEAALHQPAFKETPARPCSAR